MKRILLSIICQVAHILHSIFKFQHQPITWMKLKKIKTLQNTATLLLDLVLYVKQVHNIYGGIHPFAQYLAIELLQGKHTFLTHTKLTIMY